MAIGDVEVYGPAKPIDIAALIEAGNVLVADDITMSSYGDGMVLVLVIKAA